MWIEVSGAYGRDYKSQAAVKKDWNANKDFRITEPGGAYINKSDVDNAGLKVIVRYANNMKVMSV